MWTTNKSQSSLKDWETWGAVSLLRHICWSTIMDVGINSKPKYIATKKTRTLEAMGVMEGGVNTILKHSYEETIDIAWWNSDCRMTVTWIGGEFSVINYLFRQSVTTAEAVWLLSDGLKKGEDAFIHANGKAVEVRAADPMLLWAILGLKYIPIEEWPIVTPATTLAVAQFEVFMRLGAESSIKIFESDKGTDVDFLKRMIKTFAEDTTNWKPEDEVF